MDFKRQFVFILFVVVIGSHAFGQPKYDCNWVLGYDFYVGKLPNTINQLNFASDTLTVSAIETVEGFLDNQTVTVVSDVYGNLKFYTSGCYVVNSLGEIMENGDSITSGVVLEAYCPDHNLSPNGNLALPWPDSQGLFVLIMTDTEVVNFPEPGPWQTAFAALNLNYHIIDGNLNNGLGAVVSRFNSIINDTLAPNGLSASLHANQRDWWVLVPVARSNCYHIMLLTPDGFTASEKVCTGAGWNKDDLTGQSCFSPDGEYYVRYNTINGINLYSFNNELGTLESIARFEVPEPTGSEGVAISSNSRYMYVATQRSIYQYDLQAIDIGASRTLVLESDLQLSPSFPTEFSRCALAPDGKIYIAGTSGHKYLSVINHPDCPGLYCLPELRAVSLPSWNYFGLPNIPHYRNQPTNVSCDSMVISSTEVMRYSLDMRVYPNPADDQVSIQFSRIPNNRGSLFVYDATGCLLLEDTIQLDLVQIPTQSWPEGVYYIQGRWINEVSPMKKVVIQRH